MPSTRLMPDTQRAPTEFRYWENLDKPWARTLRAVGRRVLGFDPAPPEEVVRKFASMYFDADPLAEAFVEEVYVKRGMEAGRAMLDQALRGGARSVPDAPASLIALFADIERDPDWVDPELVEIGARAFRRYGTDIFRFAGAITLEGYSENSVAKPLVLTGAYAGDSTKNRFLETVAFWIGVSEPGGLVEGAPGRIAALRVRIMHVFVRKRLASHPEWDESAWGVPISQGDATLTLMGGSFGPGYAMRLMGYRPSKREIRAMMHFWRYVGHLMGVRPRWYPANLEEASQLSFMTLVKAARLSGDDGKHLCQSYVHAFAPKEAQKGVRKRLRERWEYGAHLGATRVFTPPWTYKHNALPSTGLWALHPLGRAPFIFAAETLRRRFPSLENVADRVARRSRERWFANHMDGREARYRPAQSFTR